MTSRERVAAPCGHAEPDRLPIDFGGGFQTGIHVNMVYRLRQALGLDAPGTPVLVPVDFNTVCEANGELRQWPENNRNVPASALMPAGGHFFDAIVRQEPIEESRLDPAENAAEFTLIDGAELRHYGELAERLRTTTDRAVFCSFGGLTFGEIALVPGVGLGRPRGIRDIEKWYVSTAHRLERGLRLALDVHGRHGAVDPVLRGRALRARKPRWLLASGAREKARRVLARIGGTGYADAATAEIERTLTHRGGETAGWKVLLEPRVRAVVAVGVVLAVLQQWSGINSIFNDSEEIYRSAGYGIGDIMFNIVVTGAINLVFTLVAMAMVDRVGRRTLMLAGRAAIGLSHLLLGGACAAGLKGLPVLLFTLCSLGAYALSLAPVTRVLIAEICPSRVRGAAVSVAVSALWAAGFLLPFAFPLLQRTAGIAATFWICAAICCAGFFFVRAKALETKGRSLEQTEQALEI